MADETVQDFLNSRKSKPAAQANVAKEQDPGPVLTMKKYVVPKVKSAGSGDSTNDPCNSQDATTHKKKVQVEIEVENFDVLFTKHLHQKSKVWDDGFLEYHVVP